MIPLLLKGRVFVLPLILFSSTAFPANKLLEVRIGYHKTFCRVVLDLTRPADVQINKDSGKITAVLKDFRLRDGFEVGPIEKNQILSSIHCRQEGDRVVAEMIMRGKFSYKSFQLDDPYRLVVDVWPLSRAQITSIRGRGFRNEVMVKKLLVIAFISSSILSIYILIKTKRRKRFLSDLKQAQRRVALPHIIDLYDSPEKVAPVKEGIGMAILEKHREIYELFDRGLKVREIAKRLGLGQGEVQLAINLRNHASSQHRVETEHRTGHLW